MKDVITIDDRAFTRFMTKEAKRQIPFVRAQTLTGVAGAAKDEMEKQFNRVFTIRKRGLLKQIRIERANKRDGANMASSVFVPEQAGSGKLLPRFDLHEKGGKIRPRRKLIAIPTKALKRSKSGGVTKTNRPTALLNKRKHFIQASRNGSLGIYKRSGKKKFPVQRLYTLVKQAKIRPTLRWEATAEAVARKEFSKRWETNMKKALSTAKR